jgi:hypothetical protein
MTTLRHAAFSVVVAIFALVGCSGKTTGTSPSGDASTDATPDASLDQDSAVVDGAVVGGDDGGDAGATPDGSPGDGCTYLSGEYTGGTAGTCHDVTILCPSTVTEADCPAACPVAFVGTDPRPVSKCYITPTDGGTTVSIDCRSPLCQG